MVRNCYGKDKNSYSYGIRFNSRKREHIRDMIIIINNYEAKTCSNFKEFNNFINNKDKVYYKEKLLQIKLNFWWYHNTETVKHNIFESYVPNGTCGFQLERLLREKREYSKPNAKEFDLYINNPQYPITTEKQFQYFSSSLYSILNNIIFFSQFKDQLLIRNWRKIAFLKISTKVMMTGILHYYNNIVPD